MSTPSSIPKLSSTQIGIIGENLLVNAVMKASNGRLSPFFDKKTGNSVAIQLKCRTKTDSGGNTAQFDVREATYKEERRAFVVAALLNEKMTEFVCSWFIPMKEVKRVGNKKSNKYVITPSKAEGSADKYKEFRCGSVDELAQRIIEECEAVS